MPQIIPIRDLRNTTEISELCHSKNEPVFITKNGYGDMVVMSVEAYEKLQFQNDVYFKLKEAELDNKNCSERYSHDEVFNEIKQDLERQVKENEV